eukprot:1379194-Pleurochrysis_carterae.AAC.4
MTVGAPRSPSRPLRLLLPTYSTPSNRQHSPRPAGEYKHIKTLEMQGVRPPSKAELRVGLRRHMA